MRGAKPGGSIHVLTIAPHGSRVFVGGGFHSIGGQPRRFFAQLDATSGQATSWQADADLGYVTSIATLGPRVYAGGDYSNIDGAGRPFLASFVDPTQVGVPAERGGPAAKVSLRAVPNPMREEGLLRFELPQDARVTLALFDLSGRRVRGVLEEAETPAGRHEAHLDARGLPPGLYFASLGFGSRRALQKLVTVP